MKDFISAKERLELWQRKQIWIDVLWIVFGCVMTAMCIYQLLKEVTYVN